MAQLPNSAIVALRGGELEAAISLHSGRVIADPFRRTADLVPLLQTRYALLSHAPAPTAVRVLRRARGALAL